MSDKKIKRNLRELKSIRYRAHARFYDRKVAERKKRLQMKIKHFEEESSRATH